VKQIVASCDYLRVDFVRGFQMSIMQHSQMRLRLVPTTLGMPMDTVPFFLRQLADSIEETASRCTDPAIVSELQYICGQLRARAEALDEQ
jgi:hypothetical protein